MKLKRVRLYGFKTFADKTEFELDGSITAIVGPNGCGKSNIVDAVLWGLGESNSRHLRAQTAKEVIFSGSRTRKPLGYGEVTLHFDNEDGSLPIDTAEVSVTRRLTRSGDSDYQINKRNCRLRDVNDLLADSGLGRAGYAIVSQSEIDQALAASPIQRRAWIDEAAGVQRYRSRRVEANRRLEAAQDHLTRVHDIIREIDLQREPLKEEAEVAIKYKAALASLREVESGLLVKEVADALADIAEQEQRIASVMATTAEDTKRAEALEEEARLTARRAAEMEARIEQVREAQQAAQKALEQASATLQVAQHRLQGLDQIESSMSEDAESAEQRIADAHQDLIQAREAADQDRLNFENLRTTLAQASDEARRFGETLAAIDAELAAARESLAAKHRWEVEMEHRANRLRQVKSELKGIEETLPDLEEGLAEAEAQVAGQESQISSLRSKVEELDGLMRGAESAKEAVADRRRELLSQHAAAEGRKRGILATIEAHEGLAQGTRAVLDSVAAGHLEPDYIPVGEAVSAEPDLAVAIETALGGHVNDLVTTNESAAKRAIEHLKQTRAGRATFQPITLMRPHTVPPELTKILGEKGVVGLADRLVSFELRYRPVVESLLGRILVVEHLDVALKLAKTTGWGKLVTLQGELVHASGAVTGGSSIRHSAGLVQRRAELLELEARLADLEASLANLDESSAHGGDTSLLLTEREAAKAALAALTPDFDDTRTWALGLRHEHQTTLQSQKRLADELTRLTTHAKPDFADTDTTEIEARRDEALKAFSVKTSDADAGQERLQEAQGRHQASQSRLHEAERRHTALVEARSGREQRMGSIGPERERYQAQIDDSTKQLDLSKTEVDRLREQAVVAIETKKSLTAEAIRLSEEARAAEKAAMASSDTLHHCEIRRARAESKRAAAVERLLEEYGIDEPQAIALAPTTEVPADAPGLVSRLRRELKAMGDVNVGAIEAYQRLDERHTELVAQTSDIESGIEEVRSTIKELDHLTRDRFLTTFEQLQTTFTETFTRMFGGGEGKLELIEPMNPLDSGVEISVTVPGKRTQRLELLSGGERAMSACAFLFSLLKVKPTPLVVLDEVDAPLDGRNVERFISMLREFEGQTQFILVTHNPVTIESADVWFGVTMQEPGVSTLVPFKVPSQERLPEVSLPAGTPAAISLKG